MVKSATVRKNSSSFSSRVCSFLAVMLVLLYRVVSLFHRADVLHLQAFVQPGYPLLAEVELFVVDVHTFFGCDIEVRRIERWGQMECVDVAFIVDPAHGQPALRDVVLDSLFVHWSDRGAYIRRRLY